MLKRAVSPSVVILSLALIGLAVFGVATSARPAFDPTPPWMEQQGSIWT